MTEPRTFASLSPTLLARKGGARPAMRPQDTSKFTAGALPIDAQRSEDLGWNDFGHGHRHEPVSSQPVMIRAAPRPEAVPANGADDGHELPEVLRQIDEIAARIAVTAPAARAMPEGRRAAFTLRLDAERHFRLKMAGVFLSRSAQVIVTEALDKYLSEMPDICAPGIARRPS